MFTLTKALLLALVGTAYAAPVAAPHRWFNRDGDNSGPMFGRTDIIDITNAIKAAGGNVVYVDQNGNILDINGSASSGSGSGSGSVDTGSGSTDTGSDSGSGSGSTNVGAGSSGSDTGYMAIVNQYRTAGGLAAFSQSSKLEGNAQKTAADGHGQMVHQLNPGSMGQVLAPGGPSDFEHVYVGGWLCEIPSLPGLNGICASASKGWSHDGQTGHAKILTSTSYTQIGCANAGGIWACDTA